MKDYKLSKLERETIITFNEAESTANIFSTSQPWINKIEKIPGCRRVGAGYEVDIPKSWIKFPKEPRTTSDAQLKALARAREKSPIARK